MLKTILIEQVSHEETNLSTFTFERDLMELNAVTHSKEDSEFPILRLDAVLDTPTRMLYDALTDIGNYTNLLPDQCLISCIVEVLPSGQEIFALILKFPPPVNQVTFFYKRFLKVDESTQVYKVILSSKGLENY